jgi:cytochrome c553
MKNLVAITIAAALLGLGMNAHAADAGAGKTKAAGCTSCHGMNGVSGNAMYPNLAGQKDVYLVKSIKDYRDGKRKDAMMEGMVKGMSDADVADIAAYFASLKP